MYNPGYHWKNRWWILLGILTFPWWGAAMVFRTLHHIAAGNYMNPPTPPKDFYDKILWDRDRGM